MQCQFVSIDGGWKCGVCGRFVKVACKTPPIATCRPGLGDRVAAGLSAVGITKERAQAVANAIGISDCRCNQRQQAMNAWGRKTLGIGGR